jgi:hypothetical protein
LSVSVAAAAFRNNGSEQLHLRWRGITYVEGVIRGITYQKGVLRGITYLKGVSRGVAYLKGVRMSLGRGGGRSAQSMCLLAPYSC